MIKTLKKKLPASLYPIVDQGLYSGNNFLFSMILPLFLGTADYGKYVYLFMIFNFSLIIWESLIIHPWILVINGHTLPENKANISPPFLPTAILITIPFTVFAGFYLDANVAEIISIYFFGAFFLMRNALRRYEFQENKWGSLITSSVFVLVIRTVCLIALFKNLDVKIAFLIFLFSDFGFYKKFQQKA